MKIWILLLGILLFGFGVPCGALVTRSEQDVILGPTETIHDDAAFMGGQVTSVGNVTGDLLLMGGTVTSGGTIGNNLEAAGGNLTLNGRVGHALRAAGSDVRIGSQVASNAMVAGGNVRITRDASIGRDLNIAAGQIMVDGRVSGNLNAAGGQVTLSGPINGDVRVRADQLRLQPGAVVRGDLYVTSPNRPQIRSGARVEGRTIYRVPPKREHRFGALFGGWLYRLLMLLAVGGLIYLIAPRGTLSAASLISDWPTSLLIGLGALIVVPIAAIIIMFTLIGLPIGLTALVLYGFLLIAGVSVAGLQLGRWLLGFLRVANPRLGWAWLLGLVVLTLVFLIPIVGGLVRFAVALLGLGAILRAIAKGRREMKMAATA